MRVSAYAIGTLALLTALAAPASADHLSPPPLYDAPDCTVLPLFDNVDCQEAGAMAYLQQLDLWRAHTEQYADGRVTEAIVIGEEVVRIIRCDVVGGPVCTITVEQIVDTAEELINDLLDMAEVHCGLPSVNKVVVCFKLHVEV